MMSRIEFERKYQVRPDISRRKYSFGERNKSLIEKEWLEPSSCFSPDGNEKVRDFWKKFLGIPLGNHDSAERLIIEKELLSNGLYATGDIRRIDVRIMSC